MKPTLRHFVAMMLIASIFMCMIVPISAANNGSDVSPAASAYINGVWAEAVGSDGQVRVNFSITATRDMDNLGASVIMIKNSSGTTVKAFYASVRAELTGYNRSYYSNHVIWYDATPGAKYYAVVYFQATKGSGGDSSTYTTAYTYA